MLAQEYGFSDCRLLRSALVSALIFIMSARHWNNYSPVKYDWDKTWNKVSSPYVKPNHDYKEWSDLDGIPDTSYGWSNSNADSASSASSALPVQPSKGKCKGKGKKGNGKRAKGLTKGKNGKDTAQRKADERWEAAGRGWKEKRHGPDVITKDDLSSSSIAWEEKGVDFVGASSFAKPPKANVFECACCSRMIPFNSWMANVWSSNGEFVEKYDEDIRRAKDLMKSIMSDEPVKYIQVGTKEPILSVCVYCCGKMQHQDSKYYLNEKGKPTSHFRGKADLSKGKNPRHKLQRCMAVIEDWMTEEGHPQRIAEVLEELKKPMFAKGSDWVAEVASGFFITYGCTCGIYPIHNGSFYRFSSIKGRDGSSGKKGFWVCAACIRRWTEGEHGHKRLVTLPADGKFSDKHKKWCFAYYGSHDASDRAKIEQQLTILKGSRLLKEINGKEVTFESICEAITAINSKCVGMLETHYAMKWITSSKEVERYGTPLYCEHDALSLRAPGIKFAAIDVKMIEAEEEIPFLSTEHFQALIDCCSAFFDFTTYDSKGPSDERMIRKMQWAAENNKSIADIIKKIHPDLA